MSSPLALLSRRLVQVLTVALVATFGVVAIPDRAEAYVYQDRANPVVMVHGYNHDPNLMTSNCAGWNPLIAQLIRSGRSGTMHTVGYYGNDVNCNARINGYGRYGVTANPWDATGTANNNDYYGDNEHPHPPQHMGTSSYRGHTSDAAIQHLAYHFAWYLWWEHTRHGRTVDVVAHSMGGLITRWALTMVAERNDRFPQYLYVEDVVTAGTPHWGASGFAIFGCRWVGGAFGWTSRQCAQMDLNYRYSVPRILRDNPRSVLTQPSTDRYTNWSVMGSGNDSVVKWDSAVGYGWMQAHHKYIWWFAPPGQSEIGHSDFISEKGLLGGWDCQRWHDQAYTGTPTGQWVYYAGNCRGPTDMITWTLTTQYM